MTAIEILQSCNMFFPVVFEEVVVEAITLGIQEGRRQGLEEVKGLVLDESNKYTMNFDENNYESGRVHCAMGVVDLLDEKLKS